MKTTQNSASILILFFLVTFSTWSCAQTRQKYTSSAPMNLYNKSNITISGLSIDGGKDACIHLTNCSNIRITRCKLQNSTDRGIRLDDCTNVTIDSCFFTKVADGVYAFKCNGSIKVNYNQFLNMVGPVPKGHAVQFNNCTGGGNSISYNVSEIINGTGANPNPEVGDIISLYQSSGLPNDPIRVSNNRLRGGGTGTGSMGMAGIVAGDKGGEYQDIENNVCVNTGYVGIQVQGGSHINIRYNHIYSDLLPWSGLGLGCANYSGAPSSDITIANNEVNWKAGYMNMKRRDTSYKPGKGVNSCDRPKGWETNIINAPLKTTTLLPDILVDPDKFISSKNKSN